MPKEMLNWWRCSECGYMFQAALPPKTCPSCREKCALHRIVYHDVAARQHFETTLYGSFDSY